ncbi:MAG: undecaprenyl-diphosphate phosphatase [Clostridiales bacterium]|nr:undecaprenyl-diphosphate phosphatase [Clostridiales bacterium]
MVVIECLKALLFGIVEGITEWLPISSTGHLILLEEYISFNGVREGFWDVFEVVIQLGAILAVLVLFWNRVWPFSKKGEVLGIIKREQLQLWIKILISCVPAAVVGLLFDDQINDLFYNSVTVAIMLIVVGVAFILVEQHNKHTQAKVTSLSGITYSLAFAIGMFQLIAAVFPGTSRSGATILGALLLGIGRKAAAEYTFVLGIPVMFGASLLRVAKFGLSFTALEYLILLVGMIVAFVVSLICIRFLMDYIKKHDFKIFGWYRIALGIVVLTVFLLQR